MEQYQYLAVMGACLALTAPLEWVFDARVYRRPRRLVATLAPIVAVFYLWDAAAIAAGHWWFDERYVTGLRLPLGVPLEELVFFIVIPICGLLSFESVRTILERRRNPMPATAVPDREVVGR